MWALSAIQKQSRLSTPAKAIPRLHKDLHCNCLTVSSGVEFRTAHSSEKKKVSQTLMQLIFINITKTEKSH